MYIRYLIPSLLSSILMYVLFYFWHGSVLNDFIRLDVNLNLFYFLSAVSYFILGLAIMFFHRMEFFIYNFPLWIRIILIGMMVGFAAYAISVVLPVSVNRTLNVKYVMLDLIWQIFEQVIGSLVYYFSYVAISFFYHPELKD
jgi:hypothetical protein